MLNCLSLRARSAWKAAKERFQDGSRKACGIPADGAPYRERPDRLDPRRGADAGGIPLAHPGLAGRRFPLASPALPGGWFRGRGGLWDLGLLALLAAGAPAAGGRPALD